MLHVPKYYIQLRMHYYFTKSINIWWFWSFVVLILHLLTTWLEALQDQNEPWLEQSLYHNETTLMFHQRYVLWKVLKSCWRSNTSITHHTGFSHLLSHASKCKWGKKTSSKSSKFFQKSEGLNDAMEIILGRVMYDSIYNSETALAKVRGELKDTEVNVRLRPGSTIK